MKIGIPQQNNNAKQFPKVVKKTDPVENGMIKAIFTGFTTLGFRTNDFDDTKMSFYVSLEFEGIEDMAGVKLPKMVREYDDGSKKEEPMCFFREIAMTDSMHHKSNGFAIAKSLDPNVPTVAKGKEKEHQYIENFDWQGNLGKTVLLQVSKKVSKAGNAYNKVESVMPLGIPLEGERDLLFFNLYEPEHKEIFDKLDFFTQKKIKESTRVPGEPEVIYRDEVVGDPEPQEPQGEPAPAPKDVDFDDQIPF